MVALVTLFAPTAAKALWSLPRFPGRWRVQRWAEGQGKAYARSPARRVTMNGFSFLVTPSASLDVYLNGITHNSSIERIIRAQVKPGGTVLDVGANIGWTARLMSNLVGPQGRVHAFEPLPTAYANLLLNVGDAPVSNIVPHKVAASDVAGQIELYVPADDTAALGTMRRPQGSESALKHVVPTLQLDSRLDEFGPVSFVKIDVEGAEHKVLLGMQALMRRDHPALAIELTDAWLRQLGSSAQALLDLLFAHGYTAFDASTSPPVPVTVAPGGQVDLVCLHSCKYVPMA